MVGDDNDHRKDQLFDWARKQIVEQNISLDTDLEFTTASDDASFRRYFRLTTGKKSFILMDAPPELENSEPFVDVGRLLFAHGIAVPQILAVDLDQGFMLLSDFGSKDYLIELNLDESDSQFQDQLYEEALKALLEIQKIPVETQLPLYNRELLVQEMILFNEWFLPRLLDLSLSGAESQLLDNTFNLLVENAEAQPQVLVHRDYHSRNLMVLSKDIVSPGILDFQDAVIGPVTYDLVSLLRDCYISWPDDYVYGKVLTYRSRLVGAGLLSKEVKESEFERWFDLMGLQRHIKVAGIFSRLNFRDGKERYLQDIPLVVSYIRRVVAKYAELSEFSRWVEEVVVEAMKKKRVGS